MQEADPREHDGNEAAPSNEDNKTKQQQKWQRKTRNIVGV